MKSAGLAAGMDECGGRNMATIRAKFRCMEITRRSYRTGTSVVLHAVHSFDPAGVNHHFWQATPDGSLVMTITNPAAADDFELGQDYYVDFTPAPGTET